MTNCNNKFYLTWIVQRRYATPALFGIAAGGGDVTEQKKLEVMGGYIAQIAERQFQENDQHASALYHLGDEVFLVWAERVYFNGQ